MLKESEFINQIICGDSEKILKEIPDNAVSLTFTSPPYNVNIPYGAHSDGMPYDIYLDWLKNMFSEIYRITRKGGRCAINIDAMTNRQEDKDKEYTRCIYAHLYDIMKKIGWKFRTEICWYKQNAVGKKTAWGSYCSPSSPTIRRNHEYVLIWSKDDWKLEGKKELIDITKEEFEQWTFSTWFITPETRKLGGHPVPFPTELAKRVIKLFSYKEDVVLDPFSGTGTTALMAQSYGRKYIGIDIDENYCQFAKNRIQEFSSTVIE